MTPDHMDCWQWLVSELTTDNIDTFNSAYKLVLSLLLGALIGFERRRKGQTAGVRTFSLISMGATLAMILSIYVPQQWMDLSRGDPTRIAAQVVSGIGFLGAGAIIQMKGSVRGLTTAAGIWMIAALGMAVGAGLYTLAVIAAVLVLFILLILEQIERHITGGSESRIIRVTVSAIVEDIEPYRLILHDHHVTLTNTYVEYDYCAPSTTLRLVILAKDPVNYVHLFDQLHEVYPTTSLSLATQL